MYKVSLYICPGNIPFMFASHPWFVINRDGVNSRYEVLFRSEDGKHLRKNFLPPFVGIGMFPYLNKFFWRARLIGSIEGEKDSLVQRLAEFIENSEQTYPFPKQYFLTGPNSNTYAQWILDQFPEFKVKLPWNAFGKNYHV